MEVTLYSEVTLPRVYCPQLQALSLDFIYPPQEKQKIGYFHFLTQHYTQLTSLSIYGDLVSSLFDWIQSPIKIYPKLAHIRIEGPVFVSAEDLPLFHGPQLPVLQELTLELGSMIDDPSVIISLASFLRSNRALLEEPLNTLHSSLIDLCLPADRLNECLSYTSSLTCLEITSALSLAQLPHLLNFTGLKSLGIIDDCALRFTPYVPRSVTALRLQFQLESLNLLAEYLLSASHLSVVVLPEAEPEALLPLFDRLEAAGRSLRICIAEDEEFISEHRRKYRWLEIRSLVNEISWCERNPVARLPWAAECPFEYHMSG